MDIRKPLPDNIHDEIRKKFSRILEIDRNMDRAVQECDRGVPLLSTLMGALKEEHDEIKNRLQAFLSVLMPTTISMALNLEVSQMEQEVSIMLELNSAYDYELQITLEVLEGLCKEDEELDGCRKDLLAKYGVATKTELPKEVASDSERREKRKDISSAIKQSFINMWLQDNDNVAAPAAVNVGFDSESAERREELKDGKKAIDGFTVEFDRKVSVSRKTKVEAAGAAELAAANVVADQSGGDYAEKTLEDVIVEMYGVSPNVVKMITESLADRNMVKKSSKKNQPDDVILQPEDAGALNWETVDFLGQHFESLKYNLVDDDLKLEILGVIKDWVFHLECNFSQLVHDLHGMMLGHVAAAAKFQEFKSALEDLKSYHNGVVPISVYKLLAMQEIPCHERENLDDKGALYNKLEFDQMVDLLLEIISKFRFLLMASGLPNAKAQNVKSEVLISYEKALKQSQESMKEIERKMKWAKKSNDQVEAPAGKGKMIMS
ncbi:laminin subunit beta-1 [Corchorus capsularis]|uniref:Laminin subunit beta-1 n=1 Tax=Corchorus capsularis TaxID=210143 RepID=A0A1R3HXQ5_COCAP|nr:laminin subunit beta-1 [Corchorus capsularis]